MAFEFDVFASESSLAFSLIYLYIEGQYKNQSKGLNRHVGQASKLFNKVALPKSGEIAFILR
jgi:hypothetical protein